MAQPHEQMQQNTASRATGAPSHLVAPPAVALPKGGGAIRGIDETFQVNPATGTGALSIPIFTSPGRGGFGPQLGLSYDSGAGNGPFGLGWSLAIPNISRRTDRGLPRYRDAEASDTFVLTGAEDLVPLLVQEGDAWRPEVVAPRTIAGVTYSIQRYRPRTEGLFARIERWTDQATGAVHWRATTPGNVTSIYGRAAAARIADPADPRRVFSWLIEESYDDRGNLIRYVYKPEDASGVDRGRPHEHNRRDTGYANRYVKYVLYGNRVPFFPDQAGFDQAAWERENTWHFQVVFDYGEQADAERPWAETQPWELRPDGFSRYRAGFEIRTQRRCRRVLMFHHFPGEPGFGDDPVLVRTTEFAYNESPVFSYLASAWQTGYLRGADGIVRSSSLPPLELAYTPLAIDSQVYTVGRESLADAPGGLAGGQYRLVDLDGEGIAGLLTEQGEGWFYKRNLGDVAEQRSGEGRTGGRGRPAGRDPGEPGRRGAEGWGRLAGCNPTEEQSKIQNPKSKIQNGPPLFAPAQLVAAMPAVADQFDAQQQWLDLAGDGQLDLALLGGAIDGFYERDNGSWTGFTPFTHTARVDWDDPNQRLVDLTGDGHADLLITEDRAFRWHPSLGENGFGPAEGAPRPFDEERGPALVFADPTQSIYLADMSGDGLPDIVRLRNGEVCYWPNLGYGRFGARVLMSDAPVFDAPDQFDQRRVRLADIDGSGTTDIAYLGRDGVDLYFNQAGNGWSAPTRLAVFPQVDNLADLAIADLLGNGTACLVWSSALPGDAYEPLRYVDLMSGQKPHLLHRIVNNMGAETTLSYAASTRFYLADAQAGRPWITRLPFPVHVVEAVEVLDRISQTRYISRYAYHHGYFDGQEREFRGFALVEQWDTDTFSAFAGHDPWPDSPHGSAPERHLPPVYTRSWYHTGAFLGGQAIANQCAAEYYAGDPQARQLPDTVLPAGLSVEETREACRALRGQLLRQEVYAVDGTEASPHPYLVTEQNVALRLLQPRRNGQPAVFLSHAREAISYHYERNPADPRISQSFTLEVDNYGNVTRTAAAAYPRRPAIPDQLPEQAQLVLTCSEASFANRDDRDDFYLVRVPFETRSYELSGIAPVATDGYFDRDELRAAIAGILPADELPYEAAPAGDRPQKRLLTHSRTRYYSDDLATPLDRDEIGAPLLPYESCQAVFSQALLEQVYGTKIGYDELAAILLGRAGDQGGYLFADGLWWVPSGRQLYAAEGELDAATAARARFYLPTAVEDPFGQRTQLAYDAPHFLFPTAVEDPLGNRVQAAIDYRVLQPWQVTDANGNRAQAAFDALGMVVGTALLGKAGETLGDSLDDFEPEPGRDAVRAALDAADPRAAAPALLGNATTRLVYDAWRYYDTQHEPQPQPNVVWTIIRETHVSDLAPDQASRLQHRLEYSDGFGRAVLAKAQAEPGPLQVYDPASGQWRAEWAGPNEQPFEPRWAGTGRTIFNNKGLPVEQYEPFFSATHRYESAAEAVMQGVTPIMSYDPLGRLVRTDLPNETFSQFDFDAWQQASWDPNDTVRESGWYAARGRPDPLAEPEPADPEARAAWLAAGHADTPAVAYLDTLGRAFLSVAHNREVRRDEPARQSGVRPATGIDVFTTKDTKGTKDSQVEATALSSWGLEPGYEIDTPGGGVEIREYRIPTRTQLDIEGNPLQIQDGRGIDTTPAADPLTYIGGNIVVRYRYAMGGVQLHEQRMDAGERWTLNDVTGKPIRAWDSRGHTLRTEYDALRRPIRQLVRGDDLVPSPPSLRSQLGSGGRGVRELLVQQTVYGEGQPDDTALNLRTRVWKVYDGAGVATSEAYDFKGNLLRGSRQLAVDYKRTPDWSENVELEEERFATSTSYDALNRPTSVVAPDASEIRPVYNEANLLEQVQARLRGAAEWTPFVTDIDYNAKGQRERIAYGNGVTTMYSYDPYTFRLAQLRSERGADGALLQDLSYTYDPAANITAIRDDAQQTVFFDNTQVSPEARYTYDALYQLTSATGREGIGQAGQVGHTDPPMMPLPHPNDTEALRRYTERYAYDATGNILAMLHQASGSSWTRRYEYAADSNRLLGTSLPGDAPGGPYTARYEYDNHGNMTRMPHLPLMQWDYRDQLRASSQQVRSDGGTPETTYYVYDGSGQRVRKVTERQAAPDAAPTRMAERVYLGGFERYRAYGGDGQAITLERETLHIMDGQQRVALVETRTVNDSSFILHPSSLPRFQLTNHLGSACLEVDAAGALISYEEYHPYGTTAYHAASGSAEVSLKRYRYTGKERDEETGLYYHGARYYASWLGRWTAADPDKRFHAYSYVLNHPTGAIDPTGQAPWFLIWFGIDTAEAPAPTPEEAPQTSWEVLPDGRLRETRIATQCTPENPEGKNYPIYESIDPEYYAGMDLTSDPVIATCIDNICILNIRESEAIKRQQEADFRRDLATLDNIKAVGGGGTIGYVVAATLSDDRDVHYAGSAFGNLLGGFGTFYVGARLSAGNFMPRFDDEVPPLELGAMKVRGEWTYLRPPTRTVWDSITPTQPVYPNSAIPISFELALPSDERVWVHPNATEHLAEYARGLAARMASPEVINLATQQQLTSLQAAVDLAARRGVPYGDAVTIGGWELRFGPPRNPGDLPVLFHANPVDWANQERR